MDNKWLGYPVCLGKPTCPTFAVDSCAPTSSIPPWLASWLHSLSFRFMMSCSLYPMVATSNMDTVAKIQGHRHHLQSDSYINHHLLDSSSHFLRSLQTKNGVINLLSQGG